MTEDLEYDWEQTWQITTVIIPNVTDKRLLRVDIYKDKIYIIYDKKELKGSLSHSVYPDDSTWYLSDDTLYIEMLKINISVWWDNVIVGHPTNKIQQLGRSISDFDPEVQKMVRKNHTDQMDKMKR